MSALTLTAAGAGAGFAVVSGTINLPRIGAWTADLVVASPNPMTGRVDLQLANGLTLKGTVARGGVLEKLFRARIVAGANGLRSFVRPKHYTAPTLRVVLTDLLGDVGETLSSTADRQVLNHQFEHWTTIKMPAARAIRCAIERAGADIVWRHLPDGTFWVGRETWPESTVTDFTEPDGATPEAGVIELSMVAPGLLPGTAIGGRRIDHIQYTPTGGNLTALAWLLP